MEEYSEYIVRLKPSAFDDVGELYQYIANELYAPATADKYIDGLYDVIESLSWMGGSYAISQNENIQKRYGPDARTVVYKKMTIIYNAVENYVLVKRVIASSLIR